MLSKSRIKFTASSVRTIKIHQTFFQRIVNVCDLELFTAGDKPEIIVRGIPRPVELREIFKK